MVTSLEQLILEIVADVLECEEDELSMTYSKEENDKWDSVNTLRMLTSIESEFDIRLDMEKFLKAETIQDIVDLVEATRK
ncbi:acyl carrier protein [Geobacillus thermoleovorans]|jgi:acyl carrier protein|uniref:acyl carrier protein n=1 Tax=Geobacillus TaxID=129337 RepID=UPI0004694036|nr:acyl carrier protein [Geobacillus thermoleovorans]